MPAKLLYRPTPQPGESAGSLLLRASHHNGYNSPLQLARWNVGDRKLPPSFALMITHKHHFFNVCEALEIDARCMEDAVLPLALSMTERRFYGITMRKERLRKSFHYCPLCLKTTGYHKRLWDHDFSHVCVEHGLALVNQCPSCNEPIEWNRKDLLYCQCGGQKLTDAESRPKKTLVDEYLLKIFRSANQAAYDDFEEILSVLKAFYGATKTIHELHELSVLGLTNPTSAAKRILDELLSDPNSLKFHPMLTMTDFSLGTGVKLKEIEKHVIRMFGQRAKPEQFFNYEGELLSYQVVAARFGISTELVAELRRSKILVGYRFKPGSPYLITKGSIHELMLTLGSLPTSNISKSVSIRECLKELSLSKAIEGLMSGNIKLAHFAWHESLLDIRIEPQSPIFSRIEEHDLVPLKEFVEFTGLHVNDVREAIKDSEEVNYFEQGITRGAQKYLTLSDAQKLVESLRHRYQKPSKVEKLRSRTEKLALPIESIKVYFR